jgi:hypothetical protein
MTKITLLAGIAALIATPALADLSAELSTAQTHAGMASTQTDVAKVHVHLQHALNCLVGPNGAGYSTAHGDPCSKAYGMGAVGDASGAQKAKLETAVASAKAGIAASDLATAQKDAKATADTVAGAK